jgi:hypothetical protein
MTDALYQWYSIGIVRMSMGGLHSLLRTLNTVMENTYRNPFEKAYLNH